MAERVISPGITVINDPVPDANGWLPIETAPRDGSSILACDAQTGEIHVCAPYALPRPVRGSDGHLEDMSVSKAGDRWCLFRLDYPNEDVPELQHGHTWSMYPTHWQPLPLPPVKASEVAAKADALLNEIRTGE